MIMCNPKLFLGWPAALFACLLLQRPAAAQETQAKNPHSLIAKYLDSQTLVIGWIDIAKIDVDELADFGDRLTSSMRPPVKKNAASVDREQRAKMKALQQALLQNKVTYVYWIAEFATIAQGVESVVVPTPNTAAVAELLNSFTGSRGNEPRFVQDGAAVLGGRQALVDALLKKEGDVAADLNAALSSNEGPHGLVALTPVPMTSTLVASPAFQSWIGNDLPSASALGQSLVGLKSISLETELPPAHGRVRVETQSAESAAKLAEFANQLLKSRLPDSAEQLTLSAKGPNITLESDSLDRSIVIYSAFQKLSGQQSPRVYMTNMKQIALALHNYMDAHGSMPPQALTDKSGKRLLSWRVLILPYLEQMALYNQFHLDEPWDSEHNLNVALAIPSVYNDVSPQVSPPRTRIVAPLTADSPFGRPGAPIHFPDVRDGTSNTVWLFQADPAKAVVWTKPEDVTINLEDPLNAVLDANHGDGPVLAGFMDGSVRAMSVEYLKKWMGPLLSIQGGELIPHDEAK